MSKSPALSLQKAEGQGRGTRYDWNWQAAYSTKFLKQPRLAIGAVLRYIYAPRLRAYALG